MNFLIIGYGSIGKRHTKNIDNLGHTPILVRHKKGRKNEEGYKEYYSVEDAIFNEDISASVICSPTSMHFSDVKNCVSNNIPFLLEKPPSVDLNTTKSISNYLLENKFKNYDIGLNLRYHPAIQFIKSYLPKLGKIYLAQISVGYYLPYWRKNVDYRKTSSAKKSLGGGVHIELIHDFDYAFWFFGLPEKVTGYVNKISNLEISTSDICSAILQYSNGLIVELHLDYLSHSYQRGCRIIAENGTLEWDMSEGNIYFTSEKSAKKEKVFGLTEKFDFNDTYIDELENFIQIIKNKSKTKVRLNYIVDVMRVIDAIQLSFEKEKYIYLNNIK